MADDSIVCSEIHCPNKWGVFFDNHMNGSGDDNLVRGLAQDPQASLERQNERLQLLLNLTTRITSNLDLREVLRAISANFRELMRCDGAGVWLPGEEAGTFKLYAFDASSSKGFAKEDLIITPAEDDPGKRAFETMKPTVATVEEIGWPGGGEGYRLAAAEGVKSACFIPLVSRGRALGDLMIVRKTEGTFTAADVDFLSQAAGQIAIAIENALAYREISELKDKLAQEKLYLEEEIRSEMNFTEIVGKSSTLRKVLKRVETVAPTDSTVLIYGETGAGKELIARAIPDLSPRKSKAFVKLNCAAIPTGLLESELFGHERGAFT
jgi:formate hydrogenlyase transcriptional activator